MKELLLNRGSTHNNYKCGKSCNVAKNDHIYDTSKLQKLKEIFNFDYLIKDCNGSDNDECCRSNQKEETSSEVRNYTYHWDLRCSKEDDYLYAPLEAFTSVSYPLSLPPPRSDDDIVPVCSSISSCQRIKNSNSSIANSYDENRLTPERQLLLHDLLSGDIYDN